MIVCLNTTHDGCTKIQALYKDGSIIAYEAPHEDVVAAMHDFLSTHTQEPVEGWCPVVGAGRFSATRRAVCIANALAFTGSSKAVAISLDLWDTGTAMRGIFEKAPSRFAQARYSGVPSISQSHEIA